MAKTRLVIFDLDGTLLDTVEDLGNAVNYALKDLGYAQHPISAYYQMVGRGIYNLFRKALPPEAVNEENVQKMAERFLPYYGAHNCDYTRPYAGITEVLEHLHAHGIHLAIASNKYQEGTEHLVDHFFGHLPFTAILGQREHLLSLFIRGFFASDENSQRQQHQRSQQKSRSRKGPRSKGISFRLGNQTAAIYKGSNY